MKILQVNKFFYLRRGAERYFFNLIKLLEEHGQTVMPFAMHDIRNLPSKYQDFFARHTDLSRPEYSLAALKKIRNIIYNREAQADVAELIQRTHPDIAHVHNIYHQLSPSILPVFKHFGLPVVMTVHDFKLISPDYSIFSHGRSTEDYLRHKYFNTIIHRTVKGSLGASVVAALASYIHDTTGIYRKNIDRLIAPSQFVKQLLVRHGWPGSTITVIPHFVDTARRLPPKTGKGYMLYVGALEPGKGIDAVLKTLYKEKIDVAWHIAGDGSARGSLVALAEKYHLQHQVSFLGQLDDAALTEEIRNCDFVIAPSRQYETFGLAVLEAFAAAKPVLAANQGALPELVHPAVGRLFNPYQSDSLAQTLRAMMTDPDLAAKGKAGYELAKAEYGAEEHYQKIMHVYQSLLG
ncbi:glycosyltransferase family 4 protein [Candidatus Falkowbacteria bacterium]|nr:glycosyltransferase family 4 protein [Candidatus Falkowbacteria bacterium]